MRMNIMANTGCVRRYLSCSACCVTPERCAASSAGFVARQEVIVNCAGDVMCCIVQCSLRRVSLDLYTPSINSSQPDPELTLQSLTGKVLVSR